MSELIVFFKALQYGLFESDAQVAGHVRGGRYVQPYTARRKRRLAIPAGQGELFNVGEQTRALANPPKAAPKESHKNKLNIGTDSGKMSPVETKEGRAMIQVIKRGEGFAVKFPFALKDSFKSAFPSAKWNPDAKQWEVGSRLKKRLDTWVEEAEAAAASAAANEEAGLIAEELSKVKNELARLQKDIGNLDALKAKIQESRSALEEARGALKAAETRKQQAEQETASEKARVDELLASVFDVAAVKQAARTMAANMVPADRNKKSRFEEARKVAGDARRKLMDAGFTLVALGKLAGANVNRPDRDHPSKILESDWYDLRSYTPDD